MTAIRWLAVGALLVLVGFPSFSQHTLHAAITSLGDVTPAPPTGGGSVSGVLRVGNAALGTMDIAGGTGLTQSGEAIVGGTVNGVGIVTLSGRNSNWVLTNNSADMTVGSSGVGSIYMENLARVDVPDDTILGSSATGVGELTINGLGTIWNSDSVVAGQSGLGTVNVVGGGRLVTGPGTLGGSATGEGRVVIADALSQWMVSGGVSVGAAGRGSLTILEGGTLRTTSASTIANAPGSVGTVEINGPGALWNAVSGATVGSAGTGKLYVFNGGRASFGEPLTLGSSTAARGEVWIDGLDSSLTVPSIAVGGGEADVIISGGASITAGGISLSSRVRVTLDNGRLQLSSQGGANQGLVRGHGTIDTDNFLNRQEGTIRGRLQVATGEHLVLTGGLNNAGLVDVHGGEFEVVGNTINSFDFDVRNGATLRFGGNGLANNSGGQLAITAGEVDVFGSVDNNQGAQILVGSGASAVFHDTITNNGDLVIMPGASVLAVEQLNFLGNPSRVRVHLTESDAFAAAAPIQAAGTIILEGDLTVTLNAGYQPQAGDEFPLLHSDAGLAGVFFHENLPSLSAGLAWQTVRTANSLSLSVVESSIAGDFDLDGDVDGRDFLVWQRNPSTGDLTDWQAGYGQAPLEMASVAVPEPTGVLLVVLGFGALVQRRGRVR